MSSKPMVPRPTEAELELLRVLWERGPLTVREVHEVASEYNDVATTSLLEVWLDETERRTWYLFETSRHGDPSTGH